MSSADPRAVVPRSCPLVAIASLLVACDDEPQWQIVGRELPAALLSVWGTSASDVYAVGGDIGDGQGPLVVHYDGTAWTRLSTGASGNLWWVYGFAGGPTYMAGDGGTILRYEQGTFTRMTTPGTDTVFGLWGASADDVWAVGGAVGGANGAFAWRLQGDTWSEAPGFPADLSATSAMWKIYGRSASDAWIVGTNGKTVRWDGAQLTAVDAGVRESLFTVHGDGERYVAVGGFGTGLILENTDGTWRDASPDAAPGLVGVCLTSKAGVAVGQDGAVYSRADSGWREEPHGLDVEETFHSVWIDPDGGTWAVGGHVLTLPVVDGIVLYEGAASVGKLP